MMSKYAAQFYLLPKTAPAVLFHKPSGKRFFKIKVQNFQLIPADYQLNLLSSTACKPYNFKGNLVCLINVDCFKGSDCPMVAF